MFCLTDLGLVASAPAARVKAAVLLNTMVPDTDERFDALFALEGGDRFERLQGFLAAIELLNRHACSWMVEFAFNRDELMLVPTQALLDAPVNLYGEGEEEDLSGEVEQLIRNRDLEQEELEGAESDAF